MVPQLIYIVKCVYTNGRSDYTWTEGERGRVGTPTLRALASDLRATFRSSEKLHRELDKLGMVRISFDLPYDIGVPSSLIPHRLFKLNTEEQRTFWEEFISINMD